MYASVYFNQAVQNITLQRCNVQTKSFKI